MDPIEKKAQPDAQREPEVHAVFEATTQTWQYICACPLTRRAVVIDPVLDAHMSGSGILTTGADEVLRLVHSHEYIIDRILETHTHASHSSAAWYLRTQLRDGGHEPRITIGKSTKSIRRLFARKYGMDDPGWTGAFDDDFSDGDFFRIGELNAHVLQLPGYLSDQVGFMIARNVFAGDALESVHQSHYSQDNVPDMDFAQEKQQASTERLLRLSPDYRIYKGHREISPLPPVYGADETVNLSPSSTVEELRAKRSHSRPVDTRRPKSRGLGIMSRFSRSSSTFPAGTMNGA